MRTTILVAILILLAGCAENKPVTPATVLPPYTPTDPALLQRTIRIVSAPCPAHISINGEYRGKTPCSAVVLTDMWGNLNEPCTIKATPTAPGQYVQQETFEGRAPAKVFFEMRIAPPYRPEPQVFVMP